VKNSLIEVNRKRQTAATMKTANAIAFITAFLRPLVGFGEIAFTAFNDPFI